MNFHTSVYFCTHNVNEAIISHMHRISWYRKDLSKNRAFQDSVSWRYGKSRGF